MPRPRFSLKTLMIIVRFVTVGVLAGGAIGLASVRCYIGLMAPDAYWEYIGPERHSMEGWALVKGAAIGIVAGIILPTRLHRGESPPATP